MRLAEFEVSFCKPCISLDCILKLKFGAFVSYAAVASEMYAVFPDAAVAVYVRLIVNS